MKWCLAGYRYKTAASAGLTPVMSVMLSGSGQAALIWQGCHLCSSMQDKPHRALARRWLREPLAFLATAYDACRTELLASGPYLDAYLGTGSQPIAAKTLPCCHGPLLHSEWELGHSSAMRLEDSGKP